VNGLRLNCIITAVRLRETRRFRSGQVSLRSGQVDFQRTCPTGQVVEKVNVEPCEPPFFTQKRGPLETS